MSRPASALPAPQSRTLLLAMILGVPLGVGLLVAAELLLPDPSLLRRYLQHPVEKAEIILFCCAVVTLVVKLLDIPRQQLALLRPVLPTYDGKSVPASEAEKYLNMAQQQPYWIRLSLLGQRRENVLQFVHSRQSAADLDDHLRSQADNAGIALDASYGLTRFITWAIPILGFLGTVLGITEAIAGVTPEVLEQSLSNVTDGLALAFDTTALALGLTMVTMLAVFLVERTEQNILEAVDRRIDEEVAHRFQRNEGVAGPSVDAMAVIVEKQAEVWARSLEAVDRRAAEAQQRQQETLTTALAEAMERATARQDARLAAMEGQVQTRHAQLIEQMATLATVIARLGQEQRAGVQQVAEALVSQGKTWQQIQQGEQHLLALQAALQQNLATLLATGSFEKTMHALMAAIHLLTSKSIPVPQLQGKAA